MPIHAPTLAAFCALALAVACPVAARAACDADQAMTKSSEISDVLSDKVQSKPEQASGLMQEIGTIMGAPVTEETCTRLDALSRRAKAL